MARYMEIAKEANVTAKELFKLITDNLPKVEDMERLGYDLTDEGDNQRFNNMITEQKGKAAVLIARIMNYGLRAAPRPVQSTVRFRAVQEAVKGLPVVVGMEDCVDEQTGKNYHKLITRAVIYEH